MLPASLAFRRSALACLLVLAGCDLRAHLEFGAWPDGTIPMLLHMDAPGRPGLPAGGLSDGSSNWNNAVIPALTQWNAVMVRSRFTHTTSASNTAAEGNGVNNVLFSSTIYGEAFSSRTAAITVIQRSGPQGVQITEADVLFNTALSWDSYRGPMRTRVDVRRVAMHEFGHVLGLSHPDEDFPTQNVVALMNSTLSDVDGLQPDDRAGAQTLYDVSVPVPTITTQPQSRTVPVGARADLAVQLNGGAPPQATSTLKYSWFFTPQGHPEEMLFTVQEGRIPIGAAQLHDRGSYYLIVETPQGQVRSNTATLTINPVTGAPATRLANISTRGIAGTGTRALIVGFVLGGTEPRNVLLRGVGPTLARFGITGAIADPRITLTQSSTQIATSNDWNEAGGSGTAALQAAFSQAGAFDLPTGSRDAALLAQLNPGVYTALVESGTGIEGIALVEAYDLDLGTTKDGRFSNLSTRGHVGTDSSLLIGGFVVSGTGPRTYVLRGVGDALAEFGIVEFLDDPLLSLVDISGAVVRICDDWDSPSFLQPELSDAFARVGAFSFVDRQESALRMTLNPGVYTIQLRGWRNSTGIALVEIYEE